jgi:transposase
VPIRLTPEAEPPRLGSVELVRPSGTVLLFPADARPELIVAVVRGLEGHVC